MRVRQQEKCARTSLRLPGLVCSVGDGEGMLAQIGQMQIDRSQSKAALDGPLPQPPSVTAAFNTFVEEDSKP